MSKRCRHENADHCGPHERFTRWAWTEHLVCIDCGAWLSLGESNDEPEAVAIEIRAAEIAADLDGIVTCSDVGENDLDKCEQCGWDDHECGIDPCQTPPGLAGYLARCIATHGDES